MTRYADPHRCPDCRSEIEQGAAACSTCHLCLAGPMAAKLFSTLSYADELLTALRQATPALAGARTTAAPTPGMLPGTRPVSPTDPIPAPDPARIPDPAMQAPRPSRLSATSVPKILLGLGAVCLLVAALIFLVVTWSVLGVAGRTATLVGFTAVATALATWVARMNLRAAAECLSVVALGLLSFDLLGARDSGWLGAISTPAFVVLLGVVLSTTATAACLGARRTPLRALVGAELVGALGTGAVVTGVVAAHWFASSAALTTAVVLAAAVTVVAHLLRLRILTIGAGAVAACSWLALVITGLDRATSHPTFARLWLDVQAWPLLVAAAMIAGLALVRTVRIGLRVTGAALAEVILVGIVLIPFGAGTATEFTLAVAVILAVACALTWFAPSPWCWSSAVTAVLGAGWMALVGGVLFSRALSRLGDAASALWSGTLDGRFFTAADLGSLEPWLLPVATLTVASTCVVLARTVPLVDRLLAPLADLAIAAAVATAVAVATIVAYPLPVWVAVASLLLAGVTFTTWSLLKDRPISLLLGGAFLVFAVGTSLYDEWFTATSLATVLGVSAVVHLRGSRSLVRTVAGGVLAASVAGSVWTWGALGDVEENWVALWVLVALVLLVTAVGAARKQTNQDGTRGAQRLAVERLGVELGALVAGAVAAVVGVEASPYILQPTWTAVYLTVAGVAASLLSLVAPDRRAVGWLGVGLLAAASWVRLWDLGVQSPEPYTLPAAAVLATAGLLHLHNARGSSTMAALSPALSLGLVPSLLWVLWQPAGLRSVLLGLTCLTLLLSGARVRWTAPVVFGAAVGALVVLRALVPAVNAIPQWVLIGSAGTLLVALGVTWERRTLEAKAVLGYVRELR